MKKVYRYSTRCCFDSSRAKIQRIFGQSDWFRRLQRKKKKQTQIAKEMLVFLIRGDFSNWKSVVSYFPSKNAITGESLKSLIIKNIDVLTEIGFKVSCVISDQSSNWSTFNQLTVSKNQPYFYHSYRKIYVLYDICHLIKSARY